MPRHDTAKTDAGLSQPLETTNQQRQEKLVELADILACIFCGLTPEQKANWMSEGTDQVAA